MFADQSKKKPRKNKLKLWIAVVALLFIVIAGGLSFYVKSALEPVDQNNKKAINVYIKEGSSLSKIAAKLKEQHLIKNEKVFIFYAKYKHASRFQAGNFQLNQAMEPTEIIDKLTNASNVPAFKLVIPEGKQLSQIAEIIAKQTHYSEQEVMKKLDNKQFISKLKHKYPNLITGEILAKKVKHPLEGYLYPATYPFHDPNTTLETIIETMIKPTAHLADKYKSQMKHKKLSVHKTLTMASLIEEEATEKVDRHKIASVFYNRLRKKMPLQTDPTVLYAMGKHKSRVVYKDLKVDSPYNTYKNAGIPPGPISNAGETAWEAALNPDKTDYIYFLAKKDGEVVFTKTFKEHSKAKRKYITNNKNH
ncbi:endolytic transglycosylase MltG [Bacillus sp. WMMC1349]|uniref:endolytic transglycosylase MltG n=1 Tax=Bacillus sp. WMMC1349 TaxID=2736254 RepID=UPI0015516F61|nr:endolytic transglycosylase MltG [Bacillus sp. WMMC1349]NPC93473.1 endolytic transglycosylase MltG [Bacillus sp. WMMC1349]